MAKDDVRTSPAGLIFVAVTIFGVIALAGLVLLAVPVVIVFNWLSLLIAGVFVAGAYVLHRRRQRRSRGPGR